MTASNQRLTDALARYRLIVAAPLTAQGQAERGVELMVCGNFSGCLDYFDRALQMEPHDALTQFNRASALNALGLFSEALAGYDRALQLGLDAPDLHHNRGISLFNLQRATEALDSIARALACRPCDNAAAICNTQGFVLQRLGRLEEARQSYRQAVALEPRLSMAQLNLGITSLALGHWQEGWEAYEWRWIDTFRATQQAPSWPATGLPSWNGEAAPDDALLVYTEQGLGDSLQFCRYLPLAAKRFRRVGVVCTAPLERLLRQSFGGDIEILTASPADTSQWQWQCLLMSLPRAFRTTEETIPAVTPYLRTLADSAQHWLARLAPAAAGRKTVGLVWAGDSALRHDARRSMQLALFKPLLARRDICWVSLQKGLPAAQREPLQEAADMLDWTEELNDFADTASLVQALDLVISVDTAVAHLAGALGKPVWLLNRHDSEWRWLPGRTDSPWYPGMRIFTQASDGDWPGVVLRVAAALDQQGHPCAF